MSAARLVFLDLETTGLDPDCHQILEVAAVVTDDAFEEMDCFEALVSPPTSDIWWDPGALRMHKASGLAALCAEQGAHADDVGDRLHEFLEQYDGYTLHLAGNSVHFDRGFIERRWADVEGMFHHRHLDVSSVRMLGERVTGAPPFGGDRAHRAMADVRRSLAELTYWTEKLRGTL